MSRENRQELIRDIEEKRSTKVITYVTSDRHKLSTHIAEDVVPILHRHILAIDPEKRNRLDLLIYSRGGDSDVPWSIVSMFREYCQEGSFSVLIPYRAHSAATVISLGADEIVMTRKAELGPIDITLTGPYNAKDEDTKERLPVSVEDVMGYFSLLQRIDAERPAEKLQAFEQLADQVHPLTLGRVSRYLEQTQLVAERLLGTRPQAFSEEKNREIVTRLSSEIYSHRHTIHRTEAVKHLGLDQVKQAEEIGIDEELWQMYEEYGKLFSLEDPFLPEQYLIRNDKDEHTWSNLNLACIESVTRLDLLQKDVKVRRLRRVPPKVSLSISLANLRMPDLPSGIDPQQVQALIQQTVQNLLPPVMDAAAKQAAREFLEALPTAGFEHSELKREWRVETNG